MHSFIPTAFTLTLAGAALAAPATTTAAPAKFQLRTVNSAELYGWALVNAHEGAGINAIQIQRPAAYVPDAAHLEGGVLVFDLKGAQFKYSARVPAVPAGGVSKVTAEVSVGTTGFAVNADDLLTFDGVANAWWACPVNNTFELFYGANVDPAKLPSPECLAIQLGAIASSS